jgi:two-component system sensor histidine kinase YesM
MVEKGDFDAKVKIEGKDEVNQLASTFNNMTDKIKKLINEVYINKIRQKELEMQMLQNQMNPHFLYNTLESIHMMAEVNRDKEVSRMARTLGKLLRYGIGRKQEQVTVKEEVEHLEDYIMLQKVRFEDIFVITVNVDRSLYECIIIKMILQPLVENAVYHGMENRSEGGKIEVKGYKSGEKIVFEVVDNGKGIDETQVKKLNDYINDRNNSFKSIGLKNINKRIRLYYGSLYGVEITSKIGIGTILKVIVPYIMPPQ